MPVHGRSRCTEDADARKMLVHGHVGAWMPINGRCRSMDGGSSWKMPLHERPWCMEHITCKMVVHEKKNRPSEDNLTHFVLWLVSGLEFFRWQLLMMWTLLFSRWHLLISSCEAHGYSDMPIKLLCFGVLSLFLLVVSLIWNWGSILNPNVGAGWQNYGCLWCVFLYKFPVSSLKST